LRGWVEQGRLAHHGHRTEKSRNGLFHRAPKPRIVAGGTKRILQNDPEQGQRPSYLPLL
jgi:hypothetical protein